MGDSPPDSHIQHERPPTFYCWRYYLTTGKVHEGCTPVETSPSGFLDLNDYGWVYIAIPVVGLFLLVFLFYCLCRGKHQNKRKPLVSDDSDIEEDEDPRVRAKSSHGQYRGIPARGTDARNYYTVVPIDPSDPRKMPLQGGVEAMSPNPNATQQRLYPRLTAMRQQAGINGHMKGKSNVTSRPKSVEAYQHNNVYQPNPTSFQPGDVNGGVPKNGPQSREPAVDHQQREDEEATSDESEEEQ